MTFTIAESIEEAVAAMADGATPLAGGTDLVVGARQGKAPLPDNLVVIDGISELQEIGPGAGGVRVGAGVTHAVLMTDPTVLRSYTALADAAALVGSPSTRNVGTLGGNVMNGSPAMDTGAPLLVFGASVVLRSAGGDRTVPVGELWTGPGQVAAEPTELCVGVELPGAEPNCGSAYVRLEYRRAMEIAVVGAAAGVTLADDGSIAAAAVALTAVAPTIIAVESANEILVGRPADEAALAAIAEAAAEQSSPISDLRAGDKYRRHCVGVMALRAVDAAARRAAGESIAVPVNRALGIGAAT